MFKFIQKYLDTQLLKTAFIFAVMYCFLFNSAVVINKFGYSNANMMTAILELVKNFVYIIITLFIIFTGFAINRKLFIICSLFLFITGATASYYLFFFSISPTTTMISSVFDTSPTEVYELISARLAVWLIFSIGICLYSIKYFNVQSPKTFLTNIISALCLVLFAMNVISPKYSVLKSYFPIQYLHNSYVYFAGSSSKYSKQDISTKFAYNDKSDEDVIAVLVIGESARYDKFGINGYERNTTPNLAKIDNLLSFKAHSCGNNTFEVIPCMLSRYSDKDTDLINTETSMLSVLTRLGFDTIWVGTQSINKNFKRDPSGTFYDEANFYVVPGGSVMFLPNDLDEKMLPYLDKYIDSNNKKFIVLHTTGSHWDYRARYPEGFAKFLPDRSEGVFKEDASTMAHQMLLNAYDNTILYTDFFLSNVIERLKDKNAFFIYVSDHGESLGENGYFTHGTSEYVKEQRIVPFIAWMSDKYKQSHKEKWDAIKQSVGMEISHNNLFHTILDCVGVESEIIDKSMSLCRYNS